MDSSEGGYGPREKAPALGAPSGPLPPPSAACASSRNLTSPELRRCCSVSPSPCSASLSCWGIPSSPACRPDVANEHHQRLVSICMSSYFKRRHVLPKALQHQHFFGNLGPHQHRLCPERSVFSRKCVYQLTRPWQSSRSMLRSLLAKAGML